VAAEELGERLGVAALGGANDRVLAGGPPAASRAAR
jgi:hypothetical protein